MRARCTTFLLVAVVAAGTLLSAAAARQAVAPGESDLDQLMTRVMASRDENWKKLRQYVLDERERIEVNGPGGARLWGERRDYTWFIRDGLFIRSPLAVNGVRISEEDRRTAEDAYLKRARAREKKALAEASDGEAGTPATVGALLAESRRPEFIDSAYFLNFKFEPGHYALVGRETFDGRSVLRIEYYPTRLFTDDPDERKGRTEARTRNGDAVGAEVERMMNKVSLVTLWVAPDVHQIVKYTFDNVDLDFLPAAWLVRVDDVQASMTMGQPFTGVWLPRDVDMRFRATLATGPIDADYHLDYHDYREAVTSGRMK